jgi:DNA-binding response OmpR family regulator
MAKIKIVDDDREMAANLAEMLASAGYTASVLTDTQGAVQELLQDKPDLLILDVMFPGNPAAGFDLARAIRQHDSLKGLPIILLTSINEEYPMDFSPGDIDENWMPVQEFLEKPVDIDKLLRRISRLLR